MHDDVTLTTGRARRVLDERIRPAIHARSLPFEVTWHVLPGEPIAPAEALALDYTAYAVGAPWGPAWSTTWFRLTATVPDEWRGLAVEAIVDLGFDGETPGFQCEGLAYRGDGSPIKAVNPRNLWVPVADVAEGGETVAFFIEAAANPVVLAMPAFTPTAEGDLSTASKHPLYVTRRMDLTVFEPELFELGLDLDVLLELQAELPERSPRRMRILQALDDAMDELDLQALPETAGAARAALSPALSPPAEASAHQIAAVGHSHIDSAWLWPIRETIRKVARTTSSMTQLIDDEPDFVFGMSSAQQYAWIAEHRPEVYARVKEAVRGGRFVPLGGMWVESDTVMPTGEAMVRQFTYGQRFFREEFGIECAGVWLPDSFGYSPALPQLIRRAGFDWFFTQKISWNQVNVFPHHTFLWEGIDGSRVFSHFPPMDTYNSELSGAEVALASRQFRESRRASRSLAPVGYGDGGGGTTREMVGRARRLTDLEGSPQVAWQHPNDFFTAARAELTDPPVWVGELYLELHRATLTSQHRTKQGNRRNEQLLIEAELWWSCAALGGETGYPYDELDRLWRQLLLLQFHDILPGTSIAWVHREVVAQHAQLTSDAQVLIERALALLVGPGDQALVANPAGETRSGVGGRSIGAPDPAGPVTPVAVDDGWVLANELVEFRISTDGLVTAAIDRTTGRDALVPGRVGNLLQLHQDLPNQWDAWDVDRFYRNSVTDLRDASAVGIEGTEVVVERAFSRSTLRQRLSLAAGERALLIETEVDWRESEKFLKAAFPLAVHAEHTAAETQFGYYRRVTHTNTSWEAAKFETAMHRYVHVAEPEFGVTLITDSTYGFDVTRDSDPEAGVTTTVRLSLLRAPRFPDPATDQGRQTFRYGLLVGSSMDDAVTAGIALNTGERPVIGGQGFDSPVTVSGNGLVLSAVKLADDRSGDLIVRVYESLGKRTTGSLAVAGRFTAYETSLLEKKLGPVEATDVDGSTQVELSLTTFEVRTLRLVRV